MLGAFLHARPLHAQTARSVRLMDLPWTEAERVLDSSSVVLIPLGAGCKEHGGHLPLATDHLQATWLTERVMVERSLVVMPEINYGYYPFFTRFPGSTTVRYTAARDMVVDICRGLSAFGPKRFYIINIGISTLPVLREAATQLAEEGILLYFTDLHAPPMMALKKQHCTQLEGTHADEVETSLMLHMHPEKVDMSKAVKDYGTLNGAGILVRTASDSGRYAPSGTYGDATLATPAKGKLLTEGLLSMILSDIDSLRSASAPAVKNDPAPTEFVGSYRMASGDEVKVAYADNTFTFTTAKGFTTALHRVTDDHFAGFSADVRFMRNDAGQVTGLEAILQNGTGISAQRVKD
ncbi:MAG: creatininase family protein [Flavobacteriales bacterium]|nr:creatininase family protein [Flavobacteriales bacterium]